jgi:transcriptional regulator of aromatic amino acid metabolism
MNLTLMIMEMAAIGILLILSHAEHSTITPLKAKLLLMPAVPVVVLLLILTTGRSAWTMKSTLMMMEIPVLLTTMKTLLDADNTTLTPLKVKPLLMPVVPVAAMLLVVIQMIPTKKSFLKLMLLIQMAQEIMLTFGLKIAT